MRMQASAAGVAIYDEAAAGGDGPFSSPLSYLGQTRFHSSLRYPAIIATPSPITVTLPSITTNQTHRRGTINLYAHGLGYIPYAEGKITSGIGQVVGLCGSVPVQTDGSFLRVVHLGADATNVNLIWYATTGSNALPSLGLTIQIYILNVALS
jgi:hypothetical protein